MITKHGDCMFKDSTFSMIDALFKLNFYISIDVWASLMKHFSSYFVLGKLNQFRFFNSNRGVNIKRFENNFYIFDKNLIKYFSQTKFFEIW